MKIIVNTRTTLKRISVAEAKFTEYQLIHIPFLPGFLEKKRAKGKTV